MTPNEQLHDLIKSVDLSNTSTTKFDALKAQVAKWLDLDPDEIYIVSAAKRASNIPIRLVQGKAKDRHHRLGVAVIGTSELELAGKHAREQATLGYDAVAIVARNGDGDYEVASYAVRTGDPLAEQLAELFPEARRNQVSPRASDSAPSAALPKQDRATQHNGEFVALPVDTLTVHDLRVECEARNLVFPDSVLAECVTAIRADKHLLLSGPPGTGKTSLAEAVAAAATSVGVTAGYVMTTATSDWTSVDTVGAYRPTRSGDLRFHPGLVVEAIARREWAIVDELNRADIDKAIGQLFTLLSGKPVVLPHEVATPNGLRRVALIPEEEPHDPRHVNLDVGGEWRLLATMNDTDLDLLYDVSQALKRRFAIIEVGPLSTSQLASLLKRLPSGDAGVDAALGALAENSDFQLGAALWIDLANYLREHVSVSTEAGLAFDAAESVRRAAALFFTPQGVAAEKVRDAVNLEVVDPEEPTPDSQQQLS